MPGGCISFAWFLCAYDVALRLHPILLVFMYPFLATVRVSSHFVVERSLSSSMSNIFPGGSMQPSCCLLLCGKVPVFSVGIWDPATDETHCARVRKHPSTSVRKRFQAFAQLPSSYTVWTALSSRQLSSSLFHKGTNQGYAFRSRGACSSLAPGKMLRTYMLNKRLSAC